MSVYYFLQHQKGQLDKELKSVTQDIEQLTYKCQKADEEFSKLVRIVCMHANVCLYMC